MLPDTPAAVFAVVGVGLIVIGILCIVLSSTVKTHFYVDAAHERPKEMQPWHVEPKIAPKHHHRYEGDKDESTRRLYPTTSKARAMPPSKLRLNPDWRENLSEEE